MILISSALMASLALSASAATPTMTSTAPLAAAVTVVLPSAAQAPLSPRTFGNIAFTGVAKRRPVAVRVRRVLSQVSRSNTRAPIAARVPRSAGALGTARAHRSAGALGIAAGLAGIFYVYGGTTTAGFDCSGFTQYVFGNLGISLPRTAEEQRQAVTSVSDPQPGDLVFLGSPASHVGIYAGNGMMWDSPRAGTAVGQHAIYSSSATYGRP